MIIPKNAMDPIKNNLPPRKPLLYQYQLFKLLKAIPPIAAYKYNIEGIMSLAYFLFIKSINQRYEINSRENVRFVTDGFDCGLDYELIWFYTNPHHTDIVDLFISFFPFDHTLFKYFSLLLHR